MIYHQGSFRNYDGEELFEQAWMPEDNPRAVLLLIHGLGEHSGRYEHVAEFFTAQGIGIETYDLRGHGKSEGRRAYVNAFDDYLRDMDIFYKRFLERHAERLVFLYGHSMGATIASLFAITRKPEFRGMILSGALLRMGADISPLLIKMSGIIGKYAPKMKTTRLDSASLSRDPQVVKDYDADPLNYRAGFPARTGYELIIAMQRIQAQIEQITLPILIMHGSADKITNPEGSQILYNTVGSKDKTIKFYNGFYHEIHNEPERQTVFSDMLDWIGTHV
ncbi:MAG TPA: alpha/beta hydrolase [Candidatus Marinimicrobia bacterium]|nr:alpha/beta hydrolase [Candidatus Neomarinimicrobiota bacterium]